MRETNAFTNDTVDIRAPEGPEVRWRIHRMVRLGADPELAAKIAQSDVDVHDIDRLVKAGCSLELAWTITQPVEEPPPAVPDADPARD